MSLPSALMSQSHPLSIITNLRMPGKRGRDRVFPPHFVQKETDFLSIEARRLVSSRSRIWLLISGWRVCVCVCTCVLNRSVVFNSATPWTAAHQACPSMGILQTRILEWVACPPPENPPNPGTEPASPALQADSLLLSHQGSLYVCAL